MLDVRLDVPADAEAAETIHFSVLVRHRMKYIRAYVLRDGEPPALIPTKSVEWERHGDENIEQTRRHPLRCQHRRRDGMPTNRFLTWREQSV